MRIGIATLAVGSALTFVGCAGSQEHHRVASQLSADCSGLSGDAVAQVYAAGTVQNVKPVYRREFRARAIRPVFVSGAELQIPAQPAMTDAYLERALSCHAARDARAASEHAADPLRVQGVENVDVRSLGPVTSISITSTDQAAAKQILQHARTLGRRAQRSPCNSCQPTCPRVRCSSRREQSSSSRAGTQSVREGLSMSCCSLGV